MAFDLAYAEGNNVTVTNTETSLAVDGGSTTLQTLTDAGIYWLFLSGVASLVKGDEYAWKVYEKAQGSAAKEAIMQGRICDAQSEVLCLPGIPLGVGWDITLQRISATSRAFYWTVRRVN